MIRTPKMIPAKSASVVQAWVAGCREQFLPSSMRIRFDAQARIFAAQPPQFWDERFHARHTDLQRKLTELLSWMREQDTELFFGAFDDELFFLYVLKFQSFWLCLSKLAPSDPVPADLERFWRDALLIQDDEHWVEWTTAAVWVRDSLPSPPPIWRIVCPMSV